MVERLSRDFGDLIEGRKTWKDMLMGFVEEAGRGGIGGSEGSGGGSRSPERRRHRRSRDIDRG